MLRIIYSLLATLLVAAAPLAAQEERSIHWLQSEEFAREKISSEYGWDSLMRARHPALFSPRQRNKISADCELEKIVFGWHPYWMGTTYERYDFSLLSDISYFSYEVNPSTGNYQTIHEWKTTNLVPMAKAAGVRVNLCVTLFSGHTTFFANPDAQRTLIDSLIALVRLRNADGVNIDFEAVPGSERENLSNFMRDLSQRFHAEIPGSQISIDLPAVDWREAFDVEAMMPYVDLFIIMGYDYYWRGSPVTGPVSPKNNGDIWSPIDVTRSVYNYLDEGIPPEKLCLGLPWYGYEWRTLSDVPEATTLEAGTARTYAVVRTLLESRERRWDPHSSTPWLVVQEDSIFRQTWYDDEISLGKKYDLILMKDLAGTAIWALGYDGGYPELWSALREKFTDCGATPCAGELSDAGGPEGSYFGSDEWTYTIAPEGATSVALSFSELDLADDRLRVYDGDDTLAPLLAEVSGSNDPGIVTARSGAMTLAFRSNEGGQGEGFDVEWSCSTQPVGVPDEKDEIPSMSITPNPTRGEIVIAADVKGSGELTIEIRDLLGRVVASRALPEGVRSAAVDLSRYPSGSYVVSLYRDGVLIESEQLYIEH